jgi:hypothetical protein
VPGTAVAEHECGVSDFDVGGKTAVKMRRVELTERLDQPETGRLVVADAVALHHDPAIAGEPDLRGFVDEVADGEHETVFADHCAIPAALGAEIRDRISVGRNFGANQHHRVERASKVELGFVGLGAQRLLESPLLRFGHAAILARSVGRSFARETVRARYRFDLEHGCIRRTAGCYGIPYDAGARERCRAFDAAGCARCFG